MQLLEPGVPSNRFSAPIPSAPSDNDQTGKVRSAGTILCQRNGFADTLGSGGNWYGHRMTAETRPATVQNAICTFIA